MGNTLADIIYTWESITGEKIEINLSKDWLIQIKRTASKLLKIQNEFRSGKRKLIRKFSAYTKEGRITNYFIDNKYEFGLSEWVLLIVWEAFGATTEQYDLLFSRII